MVKNLPAMLETWVWSLCQEDSLEEGMSADFSTLTWRIPWAEEPGWLQRVGHDWETITFTFTFLIYSLLYWFSSEPKIHIHGSTKYWKVFCLCYIKWGLLKLQVWEIFIWKLYKFTCTLSLVKMGIFEFGKKLNSDNLKFSNSYLLFPQFIKSVSSH